MKQATTNNKPETEEAPLNGLAGCTGEYTLAANSSNVVASL